MVKCKECKGYGKVRKHEIGQGLILDHGKIYMYVSVCDECLGTGQHPSTINDGGYIITTDDGLVCCDTIEEAVEVIKEDRDKNIE